MLPGMRVEVLPVGALQVNCIVLGSDTGQAWVVDPGGNAGEIRRSLSRHGMQVALYVCTHGHVDHLAALDELLVTNPAPVCLHADDAAWAFTPVNSLPPVYPRPPARPPRLRTELADGMRLAEGGIAADVLHTPGHSPGCICLRFEPDSLLLSGDTLFADSVGRTDLPGGDRKALQVSLQRLMTLPSNTRVVPGHGPETTIGRERARNPYLNGHG